MDRKHTGVYLQLHNINDQREIQRLQKVNNKQGYIKSLIRKDDSEYKKFMKGDK